MTNHVAILDTSMTDEVNMNNIMRENRGAVYRVSLVVVTMLAVVCGLLWVGSYFVNIMADIAMSSSTAWMASVNVGSLEFIYIDSLLPVASGYRFEWHGGGFLPSRLWTFYWHDRPYGWTMMLPLWVPFLFLSIWPTTATVQWLRAKPIVGLCTACGYDLRGSPSGVCPECGKEPVPEHEIGPI